MPSLHPSAPQIRVSLNHCASKVCSRQVVRNQRHRGLRIWTVLVEATTSSHLLLNRSRMQFHLQPCKINDLQNYCSLIHNFEQEMQVVAGDGRLQDLVCAPLVKALFGWSLLCISSPWKFPLSIRMARQYWINQNPSLLKPIQHQQN